MASGNSMQKSGRKTRSLVTGGAGFIDSEELAEVMRDLGIEPEPGEVLGQPGAMLSYADVEKMCIKPCVLRVRMRLTLFDFSHVASQC